MFPFFFLFSCHFLLSVIASSTLSLLSPGLWLRVRRTFIKCKNLFHAFCVQLSTVLRACSKTTACVTRTMLIYAQHHWSPNQQHFAYDFTFEWNQIRFNSGGKTCGSYIKKSKQRKQIKERVRISSLKKQGLGTHGRARVPEGRDRFPPECVGKYQYL